MAQKTDSMITPSRRTQLEITDQDIRWLVENALDYAVYVLDLEGRVNTWNKGAQHLKGYRAEEIIGQHFSVFFPTEDVQLGKPGQELQAAAAQGRFEDENWRVRKDGSRFWASVTVTAFRHEDGRLRGFIKTTRDLTEQKQAVDQQRRSRDELERLVQERTRELANANEALQKELRARQQAVEVIRALSTPVLPVRERLLILPLIGILDSARALQLTEQLLGSIRTFRAKAVVMDITGIPVVDSRVANHLLQTVEAARLMGAVVIITGISPDIAQTLVRIGVDLSRLRTMSDLRAGIEEAEQLLGYRIVRAGEVAGAEHQAETIIRSQLPVV